MDSIISTVKECRACYRTGTLHKHHIFHGTANRKLADREGLWIYLCPECHEKIHKNHDMDRWFQQVGQRRWMEKNGKSKEDFMKIFGRNYLE